MNALVTDANRDWTPNVVGLLPGSHVAVFTEEEADVVGIVGRMMGLEFRDTLLVLGVRQASYVLLFRKPVTESTVVEQVVKTGTGAINIGACRVESATPVQRGAGAFDKGNSFFGGHGAGEGQYEKGTGRIYDNIGRWPSNVVLVHGLKCRSGDCEPGCAVPLLDAQSGLTESFASFRGERHGAVYGGGKGPSGPSTVRGHADSGGASRFFPRFKSGDELRAWVTQLVTPPA